MSEHLARAQQLMEWERYEPAAASLLSALAEEPNDAIAHAMLAACHLKSRRLCSALEEVRTSLGLAPDFAYAHYVHSLILSRRGETDEAIAAVREAIRIEPHSADYLFFHAALLHDCGRLRESLQVVLAARRVDPRHVESANLHVLLLAARGKIDEAEAAIDAILSINPEFAWTHRNLAFISAQRGDFAQAVSSYREALRLKPTDSIARDGLVAALKKRNVVYRFLFWFFAADPGLLAGQAMMQGAMVSFLVLIIPGLVFAWYRDPNAIFPFWPLVVLSGTLLFMPIQLVLRILFLWLGDHAITVLLCLDPLGRKALMPEEKRAAQIAIGCVVAAIGLLMAAVVFRLALLAVVAAMSLLAAISVPFVLRHPAGPLRNNALTLLVFICSSAFAWVGLRFLLNTELAELLFVVGVWLCYVHYRSVDRNLRRRQVELSAANENQ
ncbi:MAG: hypothetical protein C0483_03930 [Pirellula sp.]|nr:hypothetical protein [Pirellula sp.]